MDFTNKLNYTTISYGILVYGRSDTLIPGRLHLYNIYGCTALLISVALKKHRVKHNISIIALIFTESTN